MSQKMSALAQPSSPLSVQTHHKFRKIRSFCAKNCGRLHLKNPLSTLDIGQTLKSFMDGP